MTRTILTLGLVICFLGSISAAEPARVLVLGGLDPVELVQGNEKQGQEKLFVEYGKFRYQFANAANKAAFEKAPLKYAVQFGGACGKMGPLSSGGSPDRFWVHEKKIYLFASESCRNAFKAAPEKHIELPDAVPAGGDADLKRGAELVQLAIKAYGAKAFESLNTYQETSQLLYPQKDKPPFEMTHTLTWMPGYLRDENSYTGWKGFTVTTPKISFDTSGKETWPLEESVREFFLRKMHRHPLLMLQARKEKGFRAVASRSGTVGETKVEWLTVAVHGATTKLALDANGRILQASYKNRTGSEVTKTYSNFKEVKGLTVPHTVEIAIDGKPVTNPVTNLKSIRVNETLDSFLFTMPD